MNTIEFLEATEDLLNNHSWVKYKTKIQDQSFKNGYAYCLTGALWEIDRTINHTPISLFPVCSEEVAKTIVKKTSDPYIQGALIRHLWNDVINRWNDKHCKSKEEAVEIINETVQRIRRRESRRKKVNSTTTN
jgi:hypothetical protein